MPRRPRTHPQQDQFFLALDDPRNRPPVAPSTPALLEALAELLLMAAQKTEGWENDAREDHR